MSESHTLMVGPVRLYQRPHSKLWQCATYLDGKEWRASTRHESLVHAQDAAREWYVELLAKRRNGSLGNGGKNFREAAEKFLPEYELLTLGQRNERYSSGHYDLSEKV